uniref:Uncharacterized protein n=1 Tax=Panagrolaimus sp. JU765 TaxID=591449 RepID=A0AC34RQI0_9BILA
MDSSYIPASGGHYAKSVYYPARAEHAPAPLVAHAIPVIGLDQIAHPSAIHDPIRAPLPEIVPINAGIRAPPQISSENALPIFVESDYATPGWGAAPFHMAASKIITNEQRRAAAIAENEAEIAQTTAEYQQALQQVERLQARLSELGIAGGQHSISGAHTGFARASGSQLGFGQQQQVRFGGINVAPVVPSAAQSAASIQAKISDYRFPAEQAIQNRQNYQNAIAESVYIGIPNNSHFAGQRQQEYAYNPVHQIPIQQAGRANSEENVHTAVLPNNIVPVIGQSGSRTNLAQANSDYHFDALRGLTSRH